MPRQREFDAMLIRANDLFARCADAAIGSRRKQYPDKEDRAGLRIVPQKPRPTVKGDLPVVSVHGFLDLAVRWAEGRPVAAGDRVFLLIVASPEGRTRLRGLGRLKRMSSFGRGFCHMPFASNLGPQPPPILTAGFPQEPSRDRQPR